jgi:DNA modification methylase
VLNEKIARKINPKETSNFSTEADHLDVLSLIPKKQFTLNAIAPYYTMFPIQFPLDKLKIAAPNDWVLDPFCGRGTTIYASRLLGLKSIGIDKDPVAVAITKAKLIKITPEVIIRECEKILSNDENFTDNIPKGEFWDLAFDNDTLAQICKIKESLLNDCKTDARIGLRGIMLGALHGPTGKKIQSYLSNQMPRTYTTKPGSAVRYWIKHNYTPKKINVLDIVDKRARRYYEDVPKKVNSQAYLHDARKIFPKKFNKKFRWIVTSPPYLGMNNYSTNQWLREWFVGGDEKPEYAIKNNLASGSPKKFEKELSNVWRNVSLISDNDAHLVIRFGALPSTPYDFESIIQKSLSYSGSEWQVEKIESAGSSEDGQRQSNQFLSSVKHSMDEIDVYARKVS